MRRTLNIVSKLNFLVFLISFFLFTANTLRVSQSFTPVDTKHLAVKPFDHAGLAVTRQQVSEPNENQTGKELGTKACAILLPAFFDCGFDDAVVLFPRINAAKPAALSAPVYLFDRNLRV